MGEGLHSYVQFHNSNRKKILGMFNSIGGPEKDRFEKEMPRLDRDRFRMHGRFRHALRGCDGPAGCPWA